MAKKSRYISAADQDKIDAQKIKTYHEMREGYDATPKADKNIRTFGQRPINGKPVNQEALENRKSVFYPDVIPPNQTHKINKPRGGFGNIADMMNQSNKLRIEESKQNKERYESERRRQIKEDTQNFEDRLRYEAEEKAYITKKQRQQEQNEFNRGMGNYQPRNYIGHVTSWTGTRVIRRNKSRNGLYNVFTSRGYTGPSGLPELDNSWNSTTGATSVGRVKGNLSIGSTRSGRRIVKGGLVPSLTPDLSYLSSGSRANSGIGSGDVIMPSGIIGFGRLKLKKRGGKFGSFF